MDTGAWDRAVLAWDEAARLGGRTAVTTRRTRREHLALVSRTIGVVDPWAVTPADLLGWFANRDWAAETRRSRRTTLRGFYAWGYGEGLVDVSPALVLPAVKPSRPNPRPAPDEVYKVAWASAGARERLMLRLAAEHGLRRAEVAQVHSRDVLEDLTGWSLVVHGKGGRERVVPLTPMMALELRGLPPGWAFPGNDHGHLSPRRVGELIGELLPGDWTMHKLRHRAATAWYDESGHDVFAVQELLGHASSNTTRAYVKVRNDKLRRIVNGAA